MITTSGHLEELRQRLIVSFGAIFLFGGLSYVFAEEIARYFMTPLFLASPTLIKLVYTNLTEAFITYLKLSLLLGIIFSIPVLLYELWMFAAPGLHANEKKTVLTIVFWALQARSLLRCQSFPVTSLLWPAHLLPSGWLLKSPS
jgi:sec-independent protein translocase protein TatC